VASPFFHEQEAKAGNVKRIRAGEAAATIIVLGTGGAMTHISGDPVPIIASALISAIFIAGYEYQIAHPSTEDADAGSPSTAGTGAKEVNTSADEIDNSVLYSFKSAASIAGGAAMAA
jgi:hypothetical protein